MFCGSTEIGAHFSIEPPPVPPSPQNFTGVLDVEPQFSASIGFMDDNTNWVLLSGCFVAEGGEAWMTIGNFSDDADTPIDPLCSVSQNSYYYIDDVSVISVDESGMLEFDLGGPVLSCGPFEIDPGITNAYFLWQDGSDEPTFLATESGVYAVTVSTACSSGIDSVEVIIPSSQDIDIGPEELFLCIGESYDISLNPELGNYIWQDGSTDAEYSIIHSGIYQVTLDDGCQLFTDEMNVIVVDTLTPFSFGLDTFLCSLETIVFDFDPDLGDFLWQDNSTSSSYTISEGGLYALTISNLCGQVTDDISIEAIEIPEIELGNDSESLCIADILYIELDPTLGDILWQDGSNASNYEISAAGLYTVFISNECGAGSDQIEVTVIEPPIVDLGPDTVVCGSGQIFLTTEPVNGIYTWQDNSQNDSLVVTSPGIYALTISNSCGEIFDNIIIDYLPLLSPVDFGTDVSLCPGEELVLHANHQNAEYLWQDGSTADTLVVRRLSCKFWTRP